MPVIVKERLWSVRDVAEYLGISVQTLYKWRQAGNGPVGYRLGKHLRYEPSAVREWVRGSQEVR